MSIVDRVEQDIVPEAVRAALERLGVAFERIACDPALSDTEDFALHYRYPLERIVNTIVVRSRTGPAQRAACVLLGSTRLDVNGAVRRRMDVRKVSFAAAEDVEELTGMPSGGVSPFGLPAGLPVWIDERVVGGIERLIVGSGERASKLLVAPGAFRAIPGATVIPDLAGSG